MGDIIAAKVYESREKWSQLFRQGAPFPHVIIDDFLVDQTAHDLCADFPKISEMYKSSVYLFGDKHELSSLQAVSPGYARLHDELTSARFQDFIRAVTGEELLVDRDFYACGLNQNEDGGFQDMHTDLNIHPVNATWLHQLSVMIYLNKDWRPEYGGALRLRASRDQPTTEIQPLFNRCVIMHSDDTTYHGYNRVNLPPGMTRKAIVSFFYKDVPLDQRPPRKVIGWDPDDASWLKRVTARLFNPIVLLKNRFLGSQTSRHRQVTSRQPGRK